MVLTHRTPRYYEDGAAGLMFPLTDTKEMAEHLVKSVKYPPLGNRGLDGAELSGGFGVRTLGPAPACPSACRTTACPLQPAAPPCPLQPAHCSLPTTACRTSLPTTACPPACPPACRTCLSPGRLPPTGLPADVGVGSDIGLNQMCVLFAAAQIIANLLAGLPRPSLSLTPSRY